MYAENLEINYFLNPPNVLDMKSRNKTLTYPKVENL